MENDQQQPPTYPFFPISDEGLKRLHQRLGQEIHLSIERDVNLGKLAPEYQRVAAENQTLSEQHAAGKCVPIVAVETPADEPIEMAGARRKNGAG